MWNTAAETMSRDHLATLQLNRLRDTIDAILAAGTPIAARLRESGVSDSQDIGTLGNLANLPFTRKSDLRQHYPFGLMTVPLDQLSRLHASSGTRGKPTVVGYTRKDLAAWAEVMARCIALAGVKPGTTIHNAYGYGLFTGGLGFHMGAELLGCLVVPVSGGLTARQIMLLQDLRASALFCTPSYALNIADHLEQAGVSPDQLALTTAICGAEPWTEEMRAEIERSLTVKALNIYGLSEIVGPGVAAECVEAQSGSHIQEDHFLPEVIDPETGVPLPMGEQGELVFTTLTKEGMPMVRYRTGDIASLDPTPCVCGRTSIRMSRVLGRIDDMLIIRGVNLYPSEVERVLLNAGEVAPHYQLVVDRPSAMDELTVLCEPADDSLEEEGRDALQDRLERALFSESGISIAVTVLPRGSVQRSEGKAVRVVDNRPL